MNLSITTFIKLALSLLLVLLSSNALAQLQPDQPTDAPPVFSKSISEVIDGPFETTIEFSQTEDQFTVVEIGGYGVNTYETLGDIELKETQWSPYVLSNYPRKFYLIEQNYCTKCILKVIAIEGNTKNTFIDIDINTYNKNNNLTRLEFNKLLRNYSKTTEDDHDTRIQILSNLLSLSKKLNETIKHIEISQTHFYRKIDSARGSIKRLDLDNLLNLPIPKNHPDYDLNLSNAYAAIGRYFLSIDDPEKSAHNYLESIKLLTNESNRDVKKQKILYNWTLAYENQQLLRIHSRKQKNHEEANQFFESTIKYAESSKNYQILVQALNSRGWSARLQNKADEAIKYLKKAFELAESRNFQLANQNKFIDSRLMLSLYHISIASAIKGRYYHALNLIERSETIAFKRPWTLWQAHIKAAKGRIYRELGRYKESESEFLHAWELYSAIGNRFELGVVSANATRLYTEMGNHERATEYLQKAYEYFSTPEDITYRIDLKAAEAESYLSQKKYNSAINLFSELLNFINESKDALFEGRKLTFLAEAYIGAGKHDKAIQTLTNAIFIAQKHNDDLYFTKANYLAALASYTLNNSAIETQKYLQSAKKTIEEIRSTLHDNSIRQQYFALQKSIYELEISMHMDFNNASKEALLSAESFRARTLFESLTGQNRTSPDKLNFRETHKKQKTTPNLAYDSSTEFLEHTLTELEENKNQSQPNRIIDSDKLAEIIQNLEKDTAILYFYTGSAQSYSWLITNKHISNNILPSGDSLALSVGNFLSSVSNSPSGRHPSKVWKSLHESSKELSGLLISPYTRKLKGIRKLLIAADGPLNRVPFSALYFGNDDKSVQLLEKLNISYISSLATHDVISRNSNIESFRDNNGLLLISNPSILSNGIIGKTLPSAELEAREISRLWEQKGDITWLKGVKADKDNLKKLDLKRYESIHFATHALANWDSPQESFIALSNSTHLNGLDSNLTLKEISNWDISAQLVVLSACDTAIGRHIDGEGPIGLSRAFIEAGAKRVLASLWPIDDEASALLMKKFYSNLYNKNQSPTEALTNAQKHLKNSGVWSHPYYWSGFHFVGDTRTWR
ncbi:CHAT domain-containing protein [Sessilibacter corallicola]|uniref:CHAT domain-containing protein n=1 Tax=Sessilibacter corallicola TaxID=2904075 RepID=A0ABQ0AE97_9GAMM